MSTQLRKTAAGRRPYRLTADQLERMLEAGIIPAGDDLELIGGVLYKLVKKEPHNFAVGQVAEALRRLLPTGFHVRKVPPALKCGGFPAGLAGVRARVADRQL
jgi:hypothetical protein